MTKEIPAGEPANIYKDELETLVKAVEELESKNARLSLRCERLQKSLKAAINRNVALKEANVFLEAENARLRTALHDAIRRPMGVVPVSAEEFHYVAEADEIDTVELQNRIEMKG